MNLSFLRESHKLDEVRLLVYQFFVSILFLHFNHYLPEEVYYAWYHIAPLEWWGWFLLTVSAFHALALSLNGDSPKVSSTIRIVGCSIHLMYVIVCGSLFLISGYMWGVLTYILFASMVHNVFRHSIVRFREYWL